MSECYFCEGTGKAHECDPDRGWYEKPCPACQMSEAERMSDAEKRAEEMRRFLADLRGTPKADFRKGRTVGA